LGLARDLLGDDDDDDDDDDDEGETASAEVAVGDAGDWVGMMGSRRCFW
jgi:hypothetical protein